MPRKPRIHFPGAVYHVILRGNARQDLFFDAEDRRRFFILLEEGISRYGFRTHGYCLMTNHVHLVLQVAESPLSQIMQNLSLRYTKWVNWRYDRIGHVFHGRYKAILVEVDSYLLELVTYLHLNPIRAKMASSPMDYPWSSHRAYLGLEQTRWLTTDFVLSQFAGGHEKAREAFQHYVSDHIGEGHRPEFHGTNCVDSRVFGDDTFVDQVLRAESEPATRPNIENVLAAVQKATAVTIEEMTASGQTKRVSEARALAAWGVLCFSDATLTELGKRFSRDVTSLSSATKRLKYRARTDVALAARMEEVRLRAASFATLQS